MCMPPESAECGTEGNCAHTCCVVTERTEHVIYVGFLSHVMQENGLIFLSHVMQENGLIFLSHVMQESGLIFLSHIMQKSGLIFLSQVMQRKVG
jgi:hypothetical protein